MKARIVKVNYTRGRVAFERQDGEYGWLEILDTAEVEEDETVTGNFTDLGRTTLRKPTGEAVAVFIEDFCSLEQALSQVFPD